MAYIASLTTSLTITSLLAEYQNRLLSINNDLRNIMNASVEASNSLIQAYKGSVTVNGLDAGSTSDDISEVIDTVNDDSFSAQWEAQLAALNAKEKMLNVEKLQIETQIKAWTTEQEGVDKIIDKNIQSTFKYMQ